MAVPTYRSECGEREEEKEREHGVRFLVNANLWFTAVKSKTLRRVQSFRALKNESVQTFFRMKTMDNISRQTEFHVS